MDFNFIGLGIWAFNVGLILLLKKQRRIGIQRSAGISGWVTLLLSLIVLTFAKISPFNLLSTTLVLIISVFVIFAVLIIYTPALSPHMNLRSFGDLSKISIKVGSIIGFVMGLIVAIFVK
jgi:peptidoglycan/LPS O-acetylase OafA/YrhL